MKHSFTLNMTAAAAAEKLKSSMKPLTIFKVLFGEDLALKQGDACGLVFRRSFDLIVRVKRNTFARSLRHAVGRFTDLENGKCKLKFRSCLSPWVCAWALAFYLFFAVLGVARAIDGGVSSFHDVLFNPFFFLMLLVTAISAIQIAAERLTKKQNEAAMFEFLSELFAPERIEE